MLSRIRTCWHVLTEKHVIASWCSGVLITGDEAAVMALATRIVMNVNESLSSDKNKKLFKDGVSKFGFVSIDKSMSLMLEEVEKILKEKGKK
jgi:hypothetical protein